MLTILGLENGMPSVRHTKMQQHVSYKQLMTETFFPEYFPILDDNAQESKRNPRHLRLLRFIDQRATSKWKDLLRVGSQISP